MGYPSSAQSFTTKQDGVDYPQASHINGLQTEITAIETALLTDGLEHDLFPQATGDARTLGTSSKYWGLSYLKGLNLLASSELTVASGAITATQGVHSVDTESDAASDDLVTITAGSGLASGFVLMLSAENVARVVTLKHGSGNIYLAGAADAALDAAGKVALLVYNGTNWLGGIVGATTAATTNPVRVLDRDVAVATVASTTSETTVYTYAVAGGTLGSTKALRLTLIGDYLNNDANPRAFTVRVKYGATTALTAVESSNLNASRGAVTLSVTLSALNATNAQAVSGILTFAEGSENNAGGTMKALSATHRQWVGTNASLAEDSTASKNLVVTVQHDASSANLSFRCHIVQVELLD
jgi:hypothetical protein